MTLKQIVSFSSEYLAYPTIRGSFIYIVLISLLSLYKIKYLITFFVPYDSFLETNILVTSISSILNNFLFL